MADFAKIEVVNDQYVISTTSDEFGEDKFSSNVYGYHNKQIMWGKRYKQVRYKTQKDAEDGHKTLKQEFSK